MKISSAKLSANIFIAITACANAQAMTTDDVLAQANRWRPQKCVPCKNWGVDIRPLTQDKIAYVIIQDSNTRIAKIHYEGETPALIYLNVHPDYQHRGIASMLVGYALADYIQQGFEKAYVKAEPIHARVHQREYGHTLDGIVKFYEQSGGMVEIHRTSTVKMVFDLNA